MSSEIEEVQPFIRYANTLDDFLAFSEFHSFRSLEAKEKRKKEIRLRSVLFAFFGLYFGYCMLIATSLGFWIMPVMTALFPAIYLLILKASKNRPNYIFRALVTRGFKKSRNKHFIGEHTISVDENGISMVTKYAEGRYAWGAIDKIESDEGYTYIHMTAIQAIIIPHNNITEGDFPALLQAIKTHYKPDQPLIKALTKPSIGSDPKGRDHVDP